MVNRYSYEFKKFASGKRKGETYCNIRSVKTGKTIKSVSSKKSLQAVNKAVAQQKTRKADEIAWKRVERDVTSRGGTKKQYRRAVKKLRDADRKAMKADPTVKKTRKSVISRTAARKTGITTTIHAFYQTAKNSTANPYTVGESNDGKDVDIEYQSDQRHVDGDNYVHNIAVLRNDFKITLEEAEESELTVFYGGYEIQVIDNETGSVLKEESRGGYYPTLSDKTFRRGR